MSSIYCPECGRENKYSYSDKPKFCGFCGDPFKGTIASTPRKNIQKRQVVVEEYEDDDEEPVVVVRKKSNKPAFHIEVDSPVSSLAEVIGTSKYPSERNQRAGVDLQKFKESVRKTNSTNIGGDS